MTETVIRIPTLRTARLVLRAPRLDDFEAFAAFRASERARALGGPFTRAEAFAQLGELIGHWHLRGFGRWMVVDATSEAPLGVVGLFHPEDWPEPEIAWALFDGAEGRGIAHEAAVAARHYAYDTLGWVTVMSLIGEGNLRSIALAQRLGAICEGSYEHPVHGLMRVYRHPGPDASRRETAEADLRASRPVAAEPARELTTRRTR